MTVALPHDAASRRTLDSVRGVAAFALLQLPLLAFLLWIFPRNLLAEGDDDGTVAIVLLATMGGASLLLLVLAPLVERHLRSGKPRFTGFPAPADPLRRYRTAKIVGLALRELVASVGFVLGLMIDDRVGYAGIALGGIALVAAWPRAEELDRVVAAGGGAAGG